MLLCTVVRPRQSVSTRVYFNDGTHTRACFFFTLFFYFFLGSYHEFEVARGEGRSTPRLPFFSSVFLFVFFCSFLSFFPSSPLFLFSPFFQSTCSVYFSVSFFRDVLYTVSARPRSVERVAACLPADTLYDPGKMRGKLCRVKAPRCYFAVPGWGRRSKRSR